MEFTSISSLNSDPLMKTFNKYNSLCVTKKRAVASVVGAAVADAATRPTHWVYDSSKLVKSIGENNPEFWPNNLSPFYSIDTGKRSCYNEESFVMLNSLPSKPIPSFDISLFKKSLANFFSPESEYAEALKLRVIAYEPSQRLKDREPIPGPWQHQAITYFLERYAADEEITGSVDNLESDGLCSTIPLIARLAVHVDDDSQASLFTTESMLVLTSNELASSHAAVSAAILRRVILTGDLTSSQVSEMCPDDIIRSEIESVIRSITEGEGHTEAVGRMGRACGYPGNFQSALRGILTSLPGSSASESASDTCSNSFVSAVRRNLLAGGCNCSRANFIGACIGALVGIGGDKGIPIDWVRRTDKGEEIFALALERVACGL